jgi:hypothetical protein
MSIQELLQKLHNENKLTGEQHNILLDIHAGNLFSLHYELRAFLYIGILLVIAGLGLTIKQYFSQFGDIAIISALTSGMMAAFIYCILKGQPYSTAEVAAPNMVFDYVLFFGCALYSMDIAYIETQFHVLGDFWNNYLLISTILFLFFAYRYDNRLVLSLALSTLAAWFGFTLSKDHFSFEEYHRLYALAYSLVTLFVGGLLYRISIKKHFSDIYLNFAVHFLFVALISGVIKYKFLTTDFSLFLLYFLVLLVCCAVLGYYALRTGKFLYMFYVIIYGYIGISVVIMDLIKTEIVLIFIYFIITPVIVIFSIFRLSRKFKENA